MAPRTEFRQGDMARRRSGGLISHSLRRRKHSDRSPINPFLKHTLFVVNFLFLLLSILTVVASTYVLVEKDKKVKSWIDFVFDPACLLCLFGSIAFLISFCGCGGGLRENVLLLRVYYIGSSILLFIEIILIVSVFVFFFADDSFAEFGDAEDLFDDLVIEYKPKIIQSDPDERGALDNIQELLSCCGVSNNDAGYLDWNKNRYFTCRESNETTDPCSVPYSCCKILEGGTDKLSCGKDKLVVGADTSNIYVRGCLKGLESTIQDNIWYIGGGLLGVLLPQIVLICFASVLVGQIKEQKRKW